MKDFVVSVLVVLVIISCGSQFLASQTKSQLLAATNPDFKKFQNIFFAPYLLSLLADWLQGPYVYRLYGNIFDNSWLITLFL